MTAAIVVMETGSYVNFEKIHRYKGYFVKGYFGKSCVSQVSVLINCQFYSNWPYTFVTCICVKVRIEIIDWIRAVPLH